MARKQVMLVVLMSVLMTAIVSVGVTLAATSGTLDPTVGPTDAGSQMVTLEQIYDRLDTGAAGSKMTGFTEPAAGPGATMHTLDEVMGAAPAVDASGALTTEVLSGKKYWGLTSGEWGLQTGSASAAGVPKTGQTVSSDTGDDGELQKGVAWPAPRFITGTTGVVTDTLTGLIWLKDASCGSLAGTEVDGRGDWLKALAAANGLADGSPEMRLQRE